MTLKQYHDQTVFTGGLNCPYLRTSVVIASDAEAALKAKDARIKELTETNNRLQDAILKDSCPWCGLNNKSNVKREEARDE